MLLTLALLACKHDDDGPGDGATPPGECGAACEAVPATPRLARLTHLQWENAVRDLLALPDRTGLSESFIGDPLAEGFDNDASGLQIGPELWQDLQRAAEAIAGEVVADPEAYGRVVPQDPRTGTGPSETHVAEGEGPDVTVTTGGSAGDAWLLWSAGTLTATFEVQGSGPFTATAVVWADQAGPDLAHATLEVDGVRLVDQDVAAASAGAAETLSGTVDLRPGAHTVVVGFTNDYYEAGGDRNLYVDRVGLAGGGAAPSSAGPAERDAWIAAFGQRAHRRPLTADEAAAYAALFDRGPDLVASGDDFRDGVRLVLTAMLQSPWFLYRVEASTAAGADGRIPLDSWELASKLSFALWNSMPDDALLARAADGTLADPAVLREEALRLIADPRARETVADLHRQLLHVDNYVNITKSDERYPEFGETTPASMQAEVQAYVEDVVFAQEGGVHALYTTPSTFVNADLAPIYGVSAAGPELRRVDLDPAERAGLLTLSGFLALEADAYTHSPIRRGVFLNLAVLCTALPPPPDVVPPLPPPEPDQTTRERVDAHTGAGTCGAGCHDRLINPLGFAFEHYDALGRWQDEESGRPVDSTDSFSFSDGERPYADAVQLSQILGDHVDAHRCYAKHLLEYVHGRHAEPEDDALLDALARQSLGEDRPIRELLVDLVLVDSFRFRAPEVP